MDDRSQLHFDDGRIRHLRARISSLIELVTARSPGDRGLLPMRIGNYIRSARRRRSGSATWCCCAPRTLSTALLAAAFAAEPLVWPGEPE